ncbi:MAG: glycosyltransferase family 39 protein, partial [Chloroflexota bacterium]
MNGLSRQSSLQLIALIVGVGCAVALTVAQLAAQEIDVLPNRFALREGVQLVLLVSSAVGMVFALAGRPEMPTIDRAHLVHILPITAFAFIVRAWDLGGVRVLVDELNSIIPLISMWVYDVPLLTHMNTNVIPYTWVFTTLQNGFVSVLGESLVGLRAASVLVGGLAVPVTYALALTFTDDRRAAVVSALALAALPVAVHYSRLAIHNTPDTLVGALALLYLARGYKHNTPTDWALGGVWLGMTHYFWEGGRLFNMAFVVLLFAWLAAQHPREAVTRWRGMARAAVAFVVMIVPLYITWGLTGSGVETRLADSGVGRVGFVNVLTSTLGDDALINYAREAANAFLVLFAIPEQS